MPNGMCSECGSTAQLVRGMCVKDYKRWKRKLEKSGLPLPPREFLRDRKCSIDECPRMANEPGGARGWCRKHYMCWKAHGDPLASASCNGCGQPVHVGALYCMSRECRRLARAAERARDPEKARAASIRRRLRQDPVKRRAAEARYKDRADRRCVRPGCEEFAARGVAYCAAHNGERSSRRYQRLTLRLGARLFARQQGRCPDVSHGGCGLPLASVNGNHVDHLVPIARGGPDDDWNLQLMHAECNLRKGDILVSAAAIAAAAHGVLLVAPDGSRRRVKPACLLP